MKGVLVFSVMFLMRILLMYNWKNNDTEGKLATGTVKKKYANLVLPL